MSDAGKGSRQRPCRVSRKQYEENWERAFPPKSISEGENEDEQSRSRSDL